MKNILLRVLVGSVVLVFGCRKEEDKDEAPQFTVFKSSGNIQLTLTEFRNSIGILNTTPNATGGRREVNWDGVPDSLLDKPLSATFFNPVGNGSNPALQRGLVYGEGDFEVSANRFAHLNAQAAAEFSAFSGAKVFANVSKLEWPVGFQVAGETAPASIEAFGMVLADVDVEGSTTLEFFEGTTSIGKFAVPAHDATTPFSFFGIRFQNRKITEVKVRHQGRLADGKKDVSQGGSDDLVVVDDLVYSEPVRR